MSKNFFSQLVESYLIAEIGVNHNGDVGVARDLVVAAKQAGADAVKFQTFTAASLAAPDTPKVRYQEATTEHAESHYQMLQRLELGKSEHRDIAAFCDSVGIDFLSTPYDIESARFLDELGVKMFKTASADLVDLPLQRFIASTGKPAIVATGMAGLGEVEAVVDIFAAAKNPHLVLLHCVSNYPCSDESLNLRAMSTLANAFGVPVGYSDHSEGFLAAVLAVARGATVIEKHFTLDRSWAGPDHKASSTPSEFAELVRNVRRAELMLGDERKRCQPEEMQMSMVSRKSVVLAHAVPAGHIFREDDLMLMRPGTGIPANLIPRLVGLRARTSLEARQRLRWDDLETA